MKELQPELGAFPPREAARCVVGGTLRLPSLGFGCAALGNLYSAVDDETACAAVAAALDLGVTHFDTAPLYGYGLSEERLGRALRGRPRASFTLATKVGRLIETARRAHGAEDDLFAVSPERRARFDYSRDGVLRSFESSLERLGVSSVDILLLHDVGRRTHADRHPQVLELALREALPAMSELKAAGACRAIGLGVNEGAVCMEILPRFDLDCVLLAGRYTLLEQSSLHEVMAEAHRRAVAVLAAAPFNSGLLGDARRPGGTYDYRAADPTVLDRARRLYELCAEEGVDVGAAALQFPLAHPAVACVVAGLRSAEEVRLAAARMRQRIPPALWDRLQRAGLLAADAPVPAP